MTVQTGQRVGVRQRDDCPHVNKDRRRKTDRLTVRDTITSLFFSVFFLQVCDASLVESDVKHNSYDIRKSNDEIHMESKIIKGLKFKS